MSISKLRQINHKTLSNYFALNPLAIILACYTFSMAAFSSQSTHVKSSSTLAMQLEKQQQQLIQVAQQEAAQSNTTYDNIPVSKFAYYENNDGVEADSTTNLGCKFKAIYVVSNAATRPNNSASGAMWTGGCSISGHTIGNGFLKIIHDNGAIEIQKAYFDEGIYKGSIIVALDFNNGNGVRLTQATIADGRAVGSITTIAPNVSIVANITGYTPSPSASNNDDNDGSDDDQPQPSMGAQIAGGLAQGLTRGVGTYRAARAPVVAARTQASAAAAQRTQANADALALAQQQSALQAQESAGYSQSAFPNATFPGCDQLHQCLRQQYPQWVQHNRLCCLVCPGRLQQLRARL